MTKKPFHELLTDLARAQRLCLLYFQSHTPLAPVTTIDVVLPIATPHAVLVQLAQHIQDNYYALVLMQNDLTLTITAV